MSMIELVATCKVNAETYESAFRKLTNVLAENCSIVKDFKIGHKAPEVGELRLCLVCAYEKPWGIWCSKTGTVVCAECRDKARA